MVQIKFELVANGSNNYGGWNIDDFCVVGASGTATPDAGPDGSRPDGGAGGSGSDAGSGSTGMGGAAGSDTTSGSGGGPSGSGGGSGAGGSAGAVGGSRPSGSSSSTGNYQPPTSGDDGGCSCHVATPRASSASWLVLALLEGLRRRR